MKIFLWTLAIMLSMVVLCALIGFIFDRWAGQRDAKRFPPEGMLVDIGGRHLHLYCSGVRTSGPTVIIEAGGATPSIVSRQVQDGAAQYAQICSYDRAGFGWSDPVESTQTFEDRADDLHTLLQHANITPPYIMVGESFGGLVVRTYANRYPDTVIGMILVDAAEEQHTFDKIALLESQSRAARIATWAAYLGVVRLLLPRSPNLALVPDQLKEPVVALMSRPSHWRAAAKESAAYTRTPKERRGVAGFGKLGSMPLMIIRHGKEFTGQEAVLENGWTEAQQRLAILSTNSKIIVAENSGHGISLEAPEVVVTAIIEMLTKVR